MLDLGWEAWVTLSVIGAVLVALVRDLARPDLVLLGALAPLLLAGILTPEDAFAGLSNSAVLAVGALFVVAAGVQNTGALSFADRLLFPRGRPPVPPPVGRTTAQLMLVTAALSAFLNNTPLVAMLIPRVQAWCTRHGVAPSKLMMPLSFGAILGGMTTLIGTSTNLLVAGLMEASGYDGLGLFDLAWAGVPAALAAIAYVGLVGHRLLPDCRGAAAGGDGLRDCLFEVRVAPAPTAGRTVEEAGLRSLGDAYLAHLRRGDQLIPAAPEAVLQPGDVLTFTGSPAALERLLERPGLERVVASVAERAHTTLPLYEAVLAPTSALVGQSLRAADFRTHYQGVVLGVHRRDAVLRGPLGRVPLQAGDLLLVEAANGFDKRWNAHRDEFYLVAPRRAERLKAQPGKAPLALAILVGVVAVAAFELASIVTTAFVGALAMITTRCLRTRDARRAVDVPVLLVIAAALGLGRAIEATGLAAALGQAVTAGAPVLGAVGAVAAVYAATSLLTEVITNNAAAALMLGIGLSAAAQLGVPPEAFATAVALAASASFLTPIGYQTNLMVMAAGGYRFRDYLATGLFVNVIVGVVTVTMIWLVWL